MPTAPRSPLALLLVVLVLGGAIAAAVTVAGARTATPDTIGLPTTSWLLEDAVDPAIRSTTHAVRDGRRRQVRGAVFSFVRATIAGRRPAHARNSPGIRTLRNWAASLPASTDVEETYVTLDALGSTAESTTSIVLDARGNAGYGQGLDTTIDIDLTQSPNGIWTVTDATLQRHGLGALHHPILQRRGRVSIVSEQSSAALARELLDIADDAAHGIPQRWPKISRRGQVVAFLIRSPELVEPITGDSTKGMHGAGFVNSYQQVVFMGDRIHSGYANAEKVELVWHELAHALTSQIGGSSMLREGFAQYVGIHAALRGAPGAYYNAATLRDAILSSRSFDFAHYLDEDEGFYAADPELEAVGYHYGLATISWIHEQWGDTRVEAFLRESSRTDGTTAARQLLHRSPAQVRDAARAWISSHPQLYG